MGQSAVAFVCPYMSAMKFASESHHVLQEGHDQAAPSGTRVPAAADAKIV